jgi:hypothetical protein
MQSNPPQGQSHGYLRRSQTQAKTGLSAVFDLKMAITRHRDAAASVRFFLAGVIPTFVFKNRSKTNLSNNGGAN